MTIKQKTVNCLCGSERAYGDCCGQYHQAKRVAETAEQLMRSRYSAFVLGDVAYLKQTWSAEQCPTDIEFDKKTRWMKLDIVSTQNGQFIDQHGQVEFKAWFIEQEKLCCLHEVSDFIRQDGQWFYKKGRIIEGPAVALTRNQPCPCGSAKKFKRCCL